MDMMLQARLWQITDCFAQTDEWGEDGVSYEYVCENGETYIYMGVDPSDGYRSALEYEVTTDGDRFESWDKNLLASFAALRIEEETEDGDGYEGGGYGYAFYDGEELIGKAWHSYGDGYYPSGWVSFDHKKLTTDTVVSEFRFEFSEVSTSLEGTYRRVVDLSPKQGKTVFVLTGEPRIGKTTFCERFLTVPYFDTDQLNKAIDIGEVALRHYPVFVVGKYRNVVAKTSKGNLSFAQLLIQLLTDQGFDVHECRFLSREDNRYEVEINQEGERQLRSITKNGAELTNQISQSTISGL